MDFSKLSIEQQQFCNTALSGKNVRVEACIGSGKTTAIQALCDLFPTNKLVLYLTYNKLLKVDAKSKIKNKNVIVTNYHGFVYPYLMRNNIKCGLSDSIRTFTENRLSIPRFDILIIDEYQDIELDFAEMLEYVKSTNPNMQIIMVGDMSQKIYDKTTLDVENWSEGFLGDHVELEFTQCFRLQPELAAKLGRIWGKTITGVNQNCKVLEMTKNEIIGHLKNKEPGEILCLGSKTGPMVDVLNILEEHYPYKFNKRTVYASIKEGGTNIEPDDGAAIFTTFDSSKGMEKPTCIVFDWDEAYWQSRTQKPDTDCEILKNIFCVAASRGKNEIIFAKSIKHGKAINLLSEKTLMTPVRRKPVEKAYVNEMFEYKYVEEIAKGYDMLDITRIDTVESDIGIKEKDAFIDLSPCIKEYQKAVFFSNYDTDARLTSAFAQRNKKAPDLSHFTPEQKLLQLVSLNTKQNRYYNQVKLPFVTPEQHNMLIDRLSERLDANEQTQIEKTMKIKDITVFGICDALRDDSVWLIEYAGALRPENFLQAGISCILFDRPYAMLWNIKTNELYKVSVDKKITDKFISQVHRIITKQRGDTIVHKPTARKNTAYHNFRIGETIKHKRFGIGCIVNIKATLRYDILEIDFEDYGLKSVSEEYILPYVPD